jgi:signal transduction histidine kinase
MTLRLRLVLTTLAIAIPVLISVGLAFRSVGQRRDDDIVRTLVLARFSSAELDACEVSPPEVPIAIPLPALRPERHEPSGRAGNLFVFTYDRTGYSRQSSAPPIPRTVLDALENAALPIGGSLGVTAGTSRQIVVLLPRPQGPCALALLTAPPLGPPLPPPHEVLVPIGFALIAGLLAIWPVVYRVRAMTLAVRGATKDHPLVLPRDDNRDELSELSQALTDSAETIRRQHGALVAREKALVAFIENTTHDLATPLTVLQGNLSALAKQPSAEVVRQAMQEAQYIGALLGNLAVSAKFEAAAHVEASLDLRDVVQRVVERHRPMANWLGVHIERAIPEYEVLTIGDPTFTECALSNLVENALRNNASGGHVAVVLETEGREFVLRVLDDGPGLTKDERERALQRAEQIDTARSRASSGGGLGLSIVARVARLQKWTFLLSAGENGGLVAKLCGPLT